MWDILDGRRLFFTGVGKSRNMAWHAADALQSVHCQAFRMDLSDALHGGLGVLTASTDTVLVFSRSGETPEALSLARHLTRLGVPFVAVTCRAGSSLETDAVHSVTLPDNVAETVPLRACTSMLAFATELVRQYIDRHKVSDKMFVSTHPGGAAKPSEAKPELLHASAEPPTIAVFVPVKLNSRRLPRKMLLPLGGKPLVSHIFDTLTAATNSIPNTTVYCYCSDPSVTEHLPAGVQFVERSAALDSDDVLGIDIYTAFAKDVPADVYALCHATSPFVKVASVRDALDAVRGGCYDSAFSAERIQTFCWYGGSPLNYAFDHVVQTQDIEPVYRETSAFYVYTRDTLLLHKRRIGCTPKMIITRMAENIDIDTRDDYELALAEMQKLRDSSKADAVDDE